MISETDHEVEERRQHVRVLRLRGLSEKACAAICGCSQSTISRDLAALREEARARYGPRGTFEPEQEISDAIELFTSIERDALLEYSGLREAAANRRISPMFVSRSRMAALRMAGTARQLRLNLLMDSGFLQRQLGTVEMMKTPVAGADQIRAYLKAEGLLPGSAAQSDDEYAEPGEKDDVVQRWLAGEDVGRPSRPS